MGVVRVEDVFAAWQGVPCQQACRTPRDHQVRALGTGPECAANEAIRGATYRLLDGTPEGVRIAGSEALISPGIDSGFNPLRNRQTGAAGAEGEPHRTRAR